MTSKHSDGPTALVVDDQAAIRSIERRVLESHGYRVLEAESAAEAIELLSAGTPLDLLIADLDMPDVRGDEMVLRIRKTRPGLKVLYVSGQIHTLMDARPLEPTEAFLDKPFTGPGLAEAVTLHLFGSIRKPAP